VELATVVVMCHVAKLVHHDLLGAPGPSPGHEHDPVLASAFDLPAEIINGIKAIPSVLRSMPMLLCNRSCRASPRAILGIAERDWLIES